MDLSDIEVLLMKRRAELQNRTAKVCLNLQQGHSKDAPEQAQERENDQVLDAICAETDAAIGDINHALERIASGRYGLCEDCGKAISEERLNAMPETVLCVDCAQHH